MIPASATVPEPQPSETPEPATPTTVPSDPESCDAAGGKLIQAELVDPDLPRSLPYRVFIPPCAEESYGEMPALYLFHGLARTDSQWDELGVDEMADRFVASGLAPRFIVVMPWERLGLDYEQAIIDHLIPHVEMEYGASSDPSLRSLGGISRGAGWALRIGVKHPELFQAIGLHSPAVLAPDLLFLPDWIMEIPDDQAPGIWIDIGDRDPLRLSLPELTAVLQEYGMAYQLTSFPGEHIESYWADHVEEYLRWYVSGWLELELGEEPQ